MLSVQAFAGSALAYRDVNGVRKDREKLQHAVQQASLLIVQNNKLAVLTKPQEEDFVRVGAHDDCAQGQPIYLLGTTATNAPWQGVVDVSEHPSLTLPPSAQLMDLRSLMSSSSIPPAQLSLAGYATSLVAWHQANRHCGRCGAPTQSIEGGSKRVCNNAHRCYPRVDPVAIMLVVSADGQRALLGRAKNLRPGMYTCLSGFIEMGESIEEAVAREVEEESGVMVEQVCVMGSQPWPIGRGGTCELMIGAIAVAREEEITLNEVEMDDCRWFSRAALAQAVDAHASPTPGGASYAGATTIEDGSLEFFIPPPLAIAHHLIKHWVLQPKGVLPRL